MMDGRIETSVIELHRFFVDWFTGRCAQQQDIFDARFSERMAPEFELIPPSGVVTNRAQLAGILWQSYGTNADFGIAIREVRTVASHGDWVLVRYQEWQRGARNSKPQNNGRVSTAVLKLDASAPQGLAWLSVHETWLPQAMMAAGSYDF